MYSRIVNHPKLIMGIFIATVIICAVCKQWVSVDYDMNDYLPEDSSSTVALDVMESNYDGGIPNARVMVKDVTIPEALEYKAKIEKTDGVTEVTWLDDVISTVEPLEVQDKDTVENYYKDGNALFSVTIEEDKRIEAVDSIKEIIGDGNCTTGSAVSTAVATTSTVKEISKIALFAVLFVILILTITTDSWMEPLIVMVGLGVAIIINAGSNLIFGTISFVTNAAGNILQLAVSLDYSVFLIHRFTECKKNTGPGIQGAKKAMVQALCMSTSSILSSGLTTVIGLDRKSVV